MATFGFDRYLNQKFYTSREWKSLRNKIIVRDNGCDLGVEGYELHGRIYIHHLNPIMAKDVEMQTDYLLNPEYLITTSFDTHNAIHYSSENGEIYLASKVPVERTKNDTCPWRK